MTAKKKKLKKERKKTSKTFKKRKVRVIKKRAKQKKVVKIKKTKIPKVASDNTIHPIRDYKSKKKAQSTQISNGVHRTKIRVIGIGGGGGSIISEIIPRIKKADFVVANTDSRALKAVKKAKRFQFGQSLTRGLGTGMNVEVGEMAAQNDKEKIKKLFEGQDLCIIIACLGGGAGSGAAPIFGKIARGVGCLTYGIFTLPFEFEGEKKMEIAKESLEKIRPHLNAYSVIPNERIFQIIDKNTPLKNALSVINKRLAETLEGLIEMIYLPGLINIDFADLKTILSGRGRLAYLNTTEIEESNKDEAAKKVISTPLYPYTIKGARGILYNISGGKEIQLLEVSQISKIVSDSVNKNAKIIFGINQSPKYKDKIKITLLAVSCGFKGFLAKPGKEEKPSFPFRRRRPSVKIPEAQVKTKPPILKKTKLLKKKPKVKQVPEPKKKRALIKKKKLSRREVLKSQKALFPKKPKIKIQLRKKEIKPLQPKEKQVKSQLIPGEKIRRNGLQLKKVIEQEEQEILEQEKVWETPAILRRKK